MKRDLLAFSKWFMANGGRAGQSLVEVLVALGVFSTVVSAVFFLFFGGQSLSVDGANAELATEYASEGLEGLRSIKDRDWELLTSGDHGIVRLSNNQWYFASGTSDARDIFTRVVSLATTSDPNIKIATTTITWQTDSLRTQKIVLVENLTKSNPEFGGCKSDPISGNWSMPQVIGASDLGAGNEGTDIAVKLPYVFVSGTAASANKPDLFVFDVSNETSPQLVRSIDVGATGIHSIYVKDNYLFAAIGTDNREFGIFNVTDPANISEVAFLDLTGATDAVSVHAYSSTTVALGRLAAAANELVFINVSNPASPSIISQAAIGGDVNNFYATNKKLYLASGQLSGDILIYDVSTPTSPTQIGAYDIFGEADDLSVYVQQREGFNLLVGNSQDEIIVIGATTTDQMYMRDRLNVAGDVNAIACVQGDLFFLGTSNSNKEFVIVDANDPDNIFEKAYLNFSQIGTGMEYLNNRVYMSVRSNDSLKIIGPGP